MTSEGKVQEHMLVPKHTILSKEEAEQLFTRYNISDKQMPQISIKDPAIAEINPEIGDVIKIERESETESKAIFYRMVKKD